MADHALPPLPPEAFQDKPSPVHDNGRKMPTRTSLEFTHGVPDALQEFTAATNGMSISGSVRASKELTRPPRENMDAESIGHDSVGGRSRSSREGARSPKKLTKVTKKEVPYPEEFTPPPRNSSKSTAQQASPAPSTSRRSLDASQELGISSYQNGSLSQSSVARDSSPRPRPPRTAPLEEPLNPRDTPERRPRSQYPEHLQQSSPAPPGSIHSGQYPQHQAQSQAAQPQQWASQSYPDQRRVQDDRDFLPQEGDGFYGGTAGYPYQQPYDEAAMTQSGFRDSPAFLDQSHLRPGDKAALLSNEQSLALYRANAKKSSDPDMVFEFAAFMLDASKTIVVPPADAAYSNQMEIEKANEKREGYVREALQLLKKIADRGHVMAQYTLADCYSNGIGTVKGRQDFDRAFPLFVAAAKHYHVDAAYRAGTCCEYGWGCRKDSAKAAHFYRAAASQQHPGSMFRLGQAEMNGELGLSKNPKEGITWLKRAAENATAEFPHALHELALCHENGVVNVIFVDLDYAAELLGQAAELGYAPSAYKLGECYEYGKMGCQADPALSIHYYVRFAPLHS